MIKKFLIILLTLILIFYLGIFLENQIKKIIGTNPSVPVDIGTSPLDRGDKEQVMVSRVIDGDTVELKDGRVVRYIGIDSPEMTDTRKEVLCVARLAKTENQNLVENKIVELEKDVSETDKYGRLLRYVWIDGKMVNQLMVEKGLAKKATYPPDIKYKNLFVVRLDLEKNIERNCTTN